MKKTLTLLPVLGAVLALGSAPIAHAGIIQHFDAAPGCLNTASEGCAAKASYVTGDGAGDPIHTVDFNNLTVTDPFGVATYSATGWQINGASAPGSDSSNYLNINDNTVTITFGVAIDYFGLYWGSIDSYNSVDIYDGNSLLGNYGGGPNGGGSAYISFNATGGQTFDKVVLHSAGCCFETDNHAYVIADATPEPGTLGTMLAVLPGYAIWRRRSQKKNRQ